VTDQAAARQWDSAVAFGLIRIGAGVALLRKRDFAIRSCGGSPSDPLLKGLFTFWGLRDIGLGITAFAATRPGGNVPKQVAQHGVADTVDTAIIVGLIANQRLPRGRGSGAAALAAGTALGEFATAWRLRRLL